MEIQLLIILLVPIFIDKVLDESLYGFWIESVHNGHILSLDSFFPVEKMFSPLITVSVHSLFDKVFKTLLNKHFVLLITFIIDCNIFYKRSRRIFFVVIQRNDLWLSMRVLFT